MNATKFVELEKKFFEFATGQKISDNEDVAFQLDEIGFSNFLCATDEGFILTFTSNEESVELVAVGATFEEVCEDMLKTLEV